MSYMEGNRRPEIKVNLGVSLERMAQLNEFIDEGAFNPMVQDFAHFFMVPFKHRAEQVNKYPSYAFLLEITPDSYLTNMSHSLSILEGDEYQGVKNPPIPEQLKELTHEQMGALYLAVPVIARAAFPKEFADEVDRQWESVLKYKGLVEDNPSKTVDEIPPIEQEITSAAMAKLFIYDKVEDYIVGLDWKWATKDYPLRDEINDKNITDLYRKSVASVLNDPKNTTHPLQLRILDAAKAEDAEVLENLGDTDTYALGKEKILTLINGSLDPQEATFTRDLLTMRVIDQIAVLQGLREEEGEAITAKFLMSNRGMQQVVSRIANVVLGDSN